MTECSIKPCHACAEVRIAELGAERDRLAEALREIANIEWVENALDPQRPGEVARAALASLRRGQR